MAMTEIATELYKMEKYGVPRTHLECLIWFHENKGKFVDLDKIKGERVQGRNSAGNLLQRRRPIPANNIVKGLHYIHGGGVRGSYKPGGAKLVGYDENKDTPQIWEGIDNFVQAIQTGDGELTGYGKEIEFDTNHNWTKINYNHSHGNYYEITGGHLQRCHDYRIPIGIIYKHDNKNEIMGLGLITKVSTNKLDYTIEPYKMNVQSEFQFVEKDFKCKKTKEDAKYRNGRFVELYDALAPKLGSRFDAAKREVGFSANSSKRKASYFGRYWERGKRVYFPYTWMGVFLATPEPNPAKLKKDFKFPSRDTVQFQIGINPHDPIWAGIFIGRKQGNKKTRNRMLDVLKNEPEEFVRRFKSLPQEYVIKIYGGKKDSGSTLRGEWNVSKLDKDVVGEILKAYSKDDTDFRVCKMFTKKEALGS